MIENHRLIFNTCDKIYENINILSNYEYHKNSHIKQIYNLSVLYLSDDNSNVIKFKNSVRNIIRSMIKSKEGEELCYKIINES
jgi:hypothetical protein